MVASALVLALLVVAFFSAEYRDTVFRPYASPGEGRDSLVAEMLHVCREKNSQLSAETLIAYCTCFANNVADAVTFRELDDPSAFQAKTESVVSTCSEQTPDR
jgi:hypothetical protein